MGTTNEKYNSDPVDSQVDSNHQEDNRMTEPDNDRSVIANGSVISHVNHIEHGNTQPTEEDKEDEIRRTSIESVEKDLPYERSGIPNTPPSNRRSTPDTPPNSPSIEILVDIGSEFPDPPESDRRYSLPDTLPDPITDDDLTREEWISDSHDPIQTSHDPIQTSHDPIQTSHDAIQTNHTSHDPIQTNNMLVQPLLNSEMEQALRELEGGCCCQSEGTSSVISGVESEDLRSAAQNGLRIVKDVRGYELLQRCA